MAGPSPSEGLNLNWAAGKDEHYLGRGTRDFSPATQSFNAPGQMISVKKGAPVVIAPKEKQVCRTIFKLSTLVSLHNFVFTLTFLQTSARGWLLASNGSQIGLLPSDAVQITSFVKNPNIPTSSFGGG